MRNVMFQFKLREFLEFAFLALFWRCNTVLIAFGTLFVCLQLLALIELEFLFVYQICRQCVVQPNKSCTEKKNTNANANTNTKFKYANENANMQMKVYKPGAVEPIRSC